MATVQRTVCDVFGTSKDVKTIRVLIQLDGEPLVTDREWLAELSPRARARVERFIERGLISVAKWKERNDGK